MTQARMALSYFDIQAVFDKEGIEVPSLDSAEFIEALYSIGFDKRFIETDECYHRPLFGVNNEVKFGKRVVSYERQDKLWLTSGRSTLDNIIGSNDDADHRRDLIMMSMQSTPTMDIIDHISKGKVEV